MRLKLTMTVAAIGSLLFGLAYLIIPDRLVALFGLTIDPFDQYPRFFGTALLGFASILWLSRKISSGPGLRAILIGSFIASIAGLVIAVLQALNGAGNSLVWSIVIIYLLLSLGFGDFVFRTPPPK
jgi:hypothetical protein